MANGFDTKNFDVDTFERHATRLLRELLQGHRQQISAITSKEISLMANKTLLQEINSRLEPSLLKTIDETATFVYPSDLALFLVAAEKEGIFDKAVEIVDTVKQERRLMSLNDLLAALAETANMPGSWAASLFGETDAERDSKPEIVTQKSSIDLAAMHRGMGL